MYKIFLYFLVFNLCFTISSFSATEEELTEEDRGLALIVHPEETPSAPVRPHSPPASTDLIRSLTELPTPSETVSVPDPFNHPQPFNTNSSLGSSNLRFSVPSSSSASRHIQTPQFIPNFVGAINPLSHAFPPAELIANLRFPAAPLGVPGGAQMPRYTPSARPIHYQISHVPIPAGPTNQDPYLRIVQLINDRTISDTQLLKKLLTRVLDGKDLDTMHPAGHDPLAVVLMRVTRPRDWVYTGAGITHKSENDKFKNCFRLLGNEIILVTFNHGYDYSKATFSGSSLEKRFKATQEALFKDLPITSKSCCSIQ